jgi:hypothetical protein
VKRFLIIVLLFFSSINFARCFLAIQQFIVLPDLPTSMSPIYLAVMSVCWASIFWVCVVAVVKKRKHAPRVSICATVLYQANLWLNHFVFTRSTEAFERVEFNALLSLVSLFVVTLPAIILERRAFCSLPSIHK